MISHTVGGAQLGAAAPAMPPAAARLRKHGARIGAALLARLLGTADGHAVAVVASRELSLILRSRNWHRCLGMWGVFCAALLLVPMLMRSQTGLWRHPTDLEWLVICGVALQLGVFFNMASWTVRRLRRDLYSNRLDELMLTRCSPADIAMGEALGSAVASVWLVLATLPACLFLSALGGKGVGTALILTLSLAPAGSLGVWFGMGWGLAFTLRRTAAMVPLTEWWVKGPFLPIWVAWSLLGCFPIAWAILSFFPGGTELLGGTLRAVEWVVRQVAVHWNPLLTVPAAAGALKTTWVTDWLALVAITAFMMRKSMDAVQISLAALPEQSRTRTSSDQWIHHDGHYFTQYFERARREPLYGDRRNPIAAYDAARGHRVYLHPFLWCVAIMAYLFLLGWSLLVPSLGLHTAVACVLVPATGALLLMSGGVAVSFGFERDQLRWPALAMLPLRDVQLALGKILGVVRPTLWVGIAASLTALLLGWRGALPGGTAPWMALHVLTFPVCLACVSAVLALATPTVGEAVYRWAVLGALPAVGTLLPHPIGGDAGVSLPFSPPLMVLILVLKGPTPELIRASWISVGVQLGLVIVSLLILTFGLRRWTVGERE